jgi:hypothetical protein
LLQRPAAFDAGSSRRRTRQQDQHTARGRFFRLVIGRTEFEHGADSILWDCPTLIGLIEGPQEIGRHDMRLWTEELVHPVKLSPVVHDQRDRLP